MSRDDGPGPRMDDLIGAERTIVARFDELGIAADYDALAVVSNIFRAAGQIRRRMETEVLATERLSWTAFTSLWVLWIWGEMESRHLAAEANVTKATLTGVLDTLEGRGLARRRPHQRDRRLVLVTLTDDGAALMARLFPRVNATETQVAAVLDPETRAVTAGALRTILRGLSSPGT